MPTFVLPWILAVIIIAVVGAACGFIEEGPRSDDPPDTGGDDPGLAVLPLTV